MSRIRRISDARRDGSIALKSSMLHKRERPSALKGIDDLITMFKDYRERQRNRLNTNADALPGLGTAILRTPQPRQTLARLPRRVPRKVSPLRPESNTFVYHLLCGRPEDIQFSARRQYWPYISRSFVGLTPDSTHQTSQKSSATQWNTGPDCISPPSVSFHPSLHGGITCASTGECLIPNWFNYL
ncbi:hypothetical protein PROFUN_05485 [Planoprotostelium fungivorum]|uniref:Uncharacterized protein n=1 Tax=Planoprotostelium fungivorum TaxID=1890364 RepID=A0A2P6NQX4_9EUKA|nr:hypothetical protein PROFUN_05485 [Planoprotostelium fungivorum]